MMGVSRWYDLGHECDQGKEFLSQEGVKFVARSIGDVQALEEILMLDARSCPATVINGDVIVGFDQEQSSDYLESRRTMAAYRRNPNAFSCKARHERAFCF